mgnify:CR=1 FL=1
MKKIKALLFFIFVVASIAKGQKGIVIKITEDLFTKNKSLRPVSTLSNGGQVGHKGLTLEMGKTPDKIIELKSDFCSVCGESLVSELFFLKAKRQVIEIPPIMPIYAVRRPEEYRQYICQCPTCQHQQLANFPLGVNAPIQYGSSVETLVGYFSVYQYIPFKRLQGLFLNYFLFPFHKEVLVIFLNVPLKNVMEFTKR